MLSSGQISFMGEATLAVSSRKTAPFHTEPNILALRKTVVCALEHDWQRNFLKRPLESPVSPLAL